MATIFVSSVDGNNADNGTTWTLAKATVAGALAIAADGDIILVDRLHNFVATAAITWTPPGGRVEIISVDRANGDVYLAGATESVGNSNNAFVLTAINLASVYIRGFTINGATFNGGLGGIFIYASSSGFCFAELDSCVIDLKAPNATPVVQLGPGFSSTGRGHKIRLTNSSIIISGSRTGISILLGEALIELSGTTISATGATKPASLFGAVSANDVAIVNMIGCDLSGYAGSAYFSVALNSSARITLTGCRINATPTITTGSWPGGIGYIQLVNVDSGHTVNSNEYRNSYGTLTETTSIYDAAGGSFNSAGISFQIVTTSACNESFPFILPMRSVWNTILTAQTATVEVNKDGATALTDREIWLELVYPSSASYPLGAFLTDRNASPFIGSAVDQATSTVGWTGTGGFANEKKQSLDVAFTAADVGPLLATVVVAKASLTAYVSARLKVA